MRPCVYKKRWIYLRGLHSNNIVTCSSLFFSFEAVCLCTCSLGLLFFKAVVVHFYLNVLFLVATFSNLIVLFVHDFSCSTVLCDHMASTSNFHCLCFKMISELTLCGVLLEWKLTHIYTGHQLSTFYKKNKLCKCEDFAIEKYRKVCKN